MRRLPRVPRRRGDVEPWPWWGQGIAYAILIPFVFAFSFALFGGWMFLPEPWDRRVAVLVYGLFALLVIATEVEKRRGSWLKLTHYPNGVRITDKPSAVVAVVPAARLGLMERYRGFAQVEYAYVRERIYPSFDWTTFEHPSPRRPLQRPLPEARVALVATAGAHLPGQSAFDLGKQGDSSYRELPADSGDLHFSHVGYDTRGARRDPDVVFPLSLLRRLATDGEIGEVAPRAFSFMGYIPEPEPLLHETGSEVARKLLADAVDLVLLVPS